MTQVEFHILSEVGDDRRMRHACKLVDEAADKAQPVFVRVGSEADARRVDDLLWTFRDQAFIPHEIAGANSPSHPLVTVLIGLDATPLAGLKTLLVNLSNEMPASFASFANVIEITDADTQRKQLARERYKQYREQGCTPEIKNL